MINIDELYEIRELSKDLEALDIPNNFYTKVDVDKSITLLDNKITSKFNESKSYTDRKISEIVGSSPDALDTLYELAAALGNNPNFATDMLELVGNKANKVHKHNSNEVTFTDGETLQEKLDNGSISGDTVQVENSFNGGVDKALSAEKGKELNTKVNKNSNKIEELSNFNPTWEECKLKGNTTINNSLIGTTKDLVIKGNTLKNICYNSNAILNSPNSRVIVARKEDLKPNTDYTIIGLFSEYNFVASDASGYGVIYNNQLEKSCFQAKGYTYFKDRYVVLKLRTRSNFDNATFGLSIDAPSNILSGTARVKTILLEGDYTSNPPSEHFDSITSSGEQEDNKIKIKSFGKNLFDKTKLTNGNLVTLDGKEYFEYYDGANNFIYKDNFKANTQYTITTKLNRPDGDTRVVNLQYVYTDGTNSAWTRNSGEVFSATSKPGKTIERIKGSYNHSGKIYIDLSVTQLEEGTLATKYEQYVEKIIEIDLPFEGGLKSLPNGASDVCENGVITQNIHKMLIPSTYDFIPYTSALNQTKTIVFYITTSVLGHAWGGNWNNMLSNRFINRNVYDTDEEGVAIDSNYKLIFRISRDKLETQDNAGFKKWLQSNETYVIGRLQTSKTYEIKGQSCLNTFNTITHITQENNIESDINFKYPSNKDSIIEGNILNLDSINSKLSTKLEIKNAVKNLDTETGTKLMWHRPSSPVGYPTLNSNAVGILSVNTHEGNYYTQLALDSYNNKLLLRSRHNTPWTNWIQVYTSQHKPTAADLGVLPLSGGTMSGEIQMNGKQIRLTSQNSAYARIGIDANTNDVYISNYNNNWLRLKPDLTMSFGGHKVYTAKEKPTPSEIGAAASSHTHDDRYYTESEINTKLDGKANANLVSTLYKKFDVGGDANTYYPVLIKPAYISGFGFYQMNISRNYGWKAPDTWNTATHKGGLTLSLELSHDTAWGGNDKNVRVKEFVESYTTMVGGLVLSTSGLIIWLRGGGATYQVDGDYGNGYNVQVTLGTFTASDDTTYAPRTNVNSVNSEVKNRNCLREDGKVYDRGSRVYSNSNKPTPADIGAAASSHTHDDRYYTESEINTKLSTKVDISKAIANIDTVTGHKLLWHRPSSPVGYPPIGSNAVAVISVNTHDGNYYSQLAFDTYENRLLFRSKHNVSWTSWTQLYTTQHKPTPADIGAAPSSHSHNYLPLSGGTLTGHLRMNAGLNIYLPNNYGIAGKDYSGVDRYMLFMDASNRVHIGYNKINNVIIDAESTSVPGVLYSEGVVVSGRESKFSNSEGYSDPTPNVICSAKFAGNMATHHLYVGLHRFDGWWMSNSTNVSGANSGPYVYGVSSDCLYFRTYNQNGSGGRDNTCYLGSSGVKFKGIYLGSQPSISSDMRKKRNISYHEDNDDKLEIFYDNLKPSSYAMKDGDTGRTHFGFIAQEVEEAMELAGMSYKDCAFLQKSPRDADGEEIQPYTVVPDPYNPGEFIKEFLIQDYEKDERIKDYEYALAYSELISVNTHFIQDLRKRVTTLEDENKNLKEEVAELKNKFKEIEALLKEGVRINAS